MDLDRRIKQLVRNYNVTREEAETAVSERDNFRKETYYKKPLSEYVAGWCLTSDPENLETLAVQINLSEMPPENVTLPTETTTGRRILYEFVGKIKKRKKKN